MSKTIKFLQEVDGSHKVDVQIDGKVKAKFVKFKYDARQIVDRDEMAPGLADRLIKLGYAVDVDDAPEAPA
jgi:hypothetical protein